MLARTLLATSLVLAAAGISSSSARDNGQYTDVSPEIKRWIEGLTDKKGRGCCATADGFRPEEVEWDTEGNNYRVRIEGKWFVIPDEAVVKDPNKIGYAIVWYYVDTGKLYIRCFLPGTGA